MTGYIHLCEKCGGTGKGPPINIKWITGMVGGPDIVTLFKLFHRCESCEGRGWWEPR